MADDVSGWTMQDKLAEAIRRSEPYMPAELWQQAKQLLDPTALTLMAGVTAGWAISHFFGVGEIADAVLVVGGGVALGASALDVGNEILQFALGAYRARTTADLDDASKHFAAALVRGGITVISALFFVKAPRVFRDFEGPIEVPAGPRNGPLFYQPTVRVAPFA